MGFDTPRKLGDRETGGGLSLPVWIDYMQYALKGVAVSEYAAPAGVTNLAGEWYYNEYARGGGISALTGGQDTAATPLPEGQTGDVPAGAGGGVQVLPPSDEKKRILDLFRN